MTENRRKMFLLLFAVPFVFATVGSASGQIFCGSIRGLPIEKGERIVGFEIRFRSGRVFALPSVPLGWDISIDNDASWTTVIKGSAEVGAASLDANFFKDFVVVEKDTSLGLQFEAGGEVIVTQDFQHERRISLRTSDLVLRPVEERRPRQGISCRDKNGP